MFEIGGKQIPATLAEMVDPKRAALLLWDMENAIAPNAFNYQEILANLKMLSGVAREIGVPVFYSVQTGFDLLKEEAGVWVRIRMKRAKASDPSQLLKEKEDPHDREIVEPLKPQAKDIVFQKRRPDGFRSNSGKADGAQRLDNVDLKALRLEYSFLLRHKRRKQVYSMR